MKKAKKAAKARKSSKSKSPIKAKAQKPAAKPANGNPYREGSMYHALFAAGAKDFVRKEDLITAVAKQTGKEARVVGYAYAVLRAPHRSNRGSREVTKGDLVKLVPVSKKG